jgi:ATP-binding cassette subfamily B protein
MEGSKPKKKKFDRALLWRIAKMARPYPVITAVTCTLALTLAPFSTLRPFLIQRMVDVQIAQRDMNGLTIMALILVGVLVLESLMEYAFGYLTSWLGAAVVRDLRSKVYRHILSRRMRFFDTTPVGQNTTRTINDIESVNQIFSEGLLTIIADVLTLVFVLGLMFYTSWSLTLVCMSVLPVLLLSSYWFKEAVKKSYQVVRTQVGAMNAYLQERISGMRIVQLFSAEPQEALRFRDINRKYTKANLDAIFAYAVFFPIVDIISAAALGLLVWYGAGRVIHHELTLGVLVVFPVYINMLFRPIRMLADKFNTLQMGMIAAERVFQLIDDTDTHEPDGRFIAKKLEGHIKFDHVGFAYNNTDPVLQDVSFELKPKKTMAIVGSTGSGKTTIISLLSRFYRPQSGGIYIDGRPLNDYQLESLRQRMAVVMQDVGLFSGSVLENITLHDPTISRAQVIEAARIIGAHDFIEALPNGYDYQVMERGATLSMGQRQLLSFIRALVFNPDILILDEATSSIDPESERIIQYAIEKLITRSTSIIIAHRLSTIRHADSILVMNKGRVVEIGTHDQLLTIENGYYRKLHDIQFAQAEQV